MAEKQPRISMADINEAISRRDLARAEHMAGMLCHEHPKDIDVWLTRARIAQMRADHKSMLDMAKAAMAISPDHVQARFITAEACIHLGEIKMAAALLKDLQSDCWQDADALVRLSEAWTQCGRFEQAVTCLKRALDLEPENADIRYHYASALIAVGRLEQAETEYDRVIAINPHDYDAWYNRAGLRRQTPKNNHIDAIRALLAAPLKHPMGHVQLNYALAKELEDIGKYEESFKALKTGADARRRMLSYKVETDTKAMEAIKATFDADFFRRDHTACMSPAPIFIVGYPRSGTTLLDRILSAHSDVESLGELTDFALALTTLARAQGGKSGLIAASARLDMQALGQAYLRRAGQRACGKPYFIDKTPANFLYIGLIAKALPNAKIIHMNRHLADVGFGMYKTLFRMGYPFSYDLGDLAAYMKAKEDLMAHWRRCLPGKIIDVQYEDIVADQPGETRRVLEALGLDWDAACLEFHKNKSPSATASAAQVRQPIYKSAVGRWQHYKTGLAPLLDALEISH